MGSISENGRLGYGIAAGPRLLLRARNGLLECSSFADIAVGRSLELALLDLLLDDPQFGQLLALLLLQLEVDVDRRADAAAFVVARAGTRQRALPERLRHLTAAFQAQAAADGRQDGHGRRHERRRLLLLPHHGRIEAAVEHSRHERLVLRAVHRVPVLLHKCSTILLINIEISK